MTTDAPRRKKDRQRIDPRVLACKVGEYHESALPAALLPFSEMPIFQRLPADSALLPSGAVEGALTCIPEPPDRLELGLVVVLAGGEYHTQSRHFAAPPGITAVEAQALYLREAGILRDEFTITPGPSPQAERSRGPSP